MFLLSGADAPLSFRFEIQMMQAMCSRVFICWLAVALGAGSAMGATDPDSGLPDVHDVLERLLKRAKQEETNEQFFRDNYAWYRVRTILEFNGKGELTRTNQFKQDFFPQGAAEGSRTTSTNQVSYREKDFALTRELLDRFQFQVKRREWVKGRPVVLLDFEPAARKLPVHSLKDKFINLTAGRLWVDEQEGVLVKADVHLTDTVNIAGGIAGAVKRFQYAFERTRTPEGLWYVVSAQWNLEARELFSQKRMAFEEHKENVLRLKKRP